MLGFESHSLSLFFLPPSCSHSLFLSLPLSLSRLTCLE